ncbi:MAG: PQQ-binding-like beta-propeller repeat protein [Gemmataceae bacterium]
MSVFVLFTPLFAPAQELSWPQFRGADCGGVCREAKALPVSFGPAKGYAWKTSLPSGISSPCIWGKRIFLTGYDAKAKKLETLCLDRATGAVLWRTPAPADKIEAVYKINSPAAATPCTDGKRVYVSFGSFGLLCYDLEGKELWRLPLPRPPARFGTATSPVVHDDLVLLNSQGKDLHLIAVKAASGEIAWEAKGTPFPSDHPVPLVWKHDGVSEVVISGRTGAIAHDLRDGSKRWWIPGLSQEACSSPILGERLLYIASHMPGGDPELRMTLPTWAEMLAYDKNKDGKISRGELPKGPVIFNRGGKDGEGEIHLGYMFGLYDRNGDGFIDQAEWEATLKRPFNNSLLAIRPGGLKDISATHVVWQAKRGVPEVPSPLLYQGYIYMIRNGGVLTCVDAKSGKEAYASQRLPAAGIYYASPVAGDGKIYLASDSGVVTVVKAGPKYEVLAENDLGEVIRATPALVDGRIYLRTAGHLYAFGE